VLSDLSGELNRVRIGLKGDTWFECCATARLYLKVICAHRKTRLGPGPKLMNFMGIGCRLSQKYILLFALFLPSVSFSLTENDFEKIARSENAELKALYERKEALQGNQEEAELIYGWQFIGELNKRFDKRQSSIPGFTYDSMHMTGAKVGIQKVFSFGLESRLTLDSTQTRITNGNAGTGAFDSANWETLPSLELKFPLLSGGFGRQVRANYQLQVFQKKLEALQAEASYDRKMNEAKTLLWSTVLQKELLASRAETLKRIQKIYSIVSKKAEQNLEDSSNFLQTRSALEQAQLDLQSAQLKYSQLERLLELVLKKVSGVAVPTYDFNKFQKVDLKSVLQKVTAEDKIASIAQDLQFQSATLNAESNRSHLDLIVSTAYGGKDNDWSESLEQSRKGRHPNQFVGIQWTVPLDTGITGRAIDRQAVLEKTSLAIKMYYQSAQSRALAEELVSQANQMVEMLFLNLKLEETQTDKLKNERRLLNQGRSSIYQVLQFELDLARAQSGKFALALELEKTFQQLSQYRYSSYE